MSDVGYPIDKETYDKFEAMMKDKAVESLSRRNWTPFDFEITRIDFDGSYDGDTHVLLCIKCQVIVKFLGG